VQRDFFYFGSEKKTDSVQNEFGLVRLEKCSSDIIVITTYVKLSS